MKLALILLAAINVAFILFLLIREWENFTPRARKFISLFTLGIFPVFWGTGVVFHNLEQVKTVEFCSQCHVMTPYVESLDVDDDEAISAIHYQNNWVPQKEACYSCHTNYTMFGPVNAKLNGLLHLYVYYIKGAPDKITLYDEYKNSNCLRCHGPARRFAEVTAHSAGKDMQTKIRSGEKSCLSKGCHDIAHLLESDEEDW